MNYKVLNRTFYNNMTFLTLSGFIKPIKVGDSINAGAFKVLSGFTPGYSTIENPRTILVVIGECRADEVYY
ncbi:MAG: hypothetical protein K6F44_01115 [Lachnospiraceae bacterium]|nr:hypothetical protein [Lachnospiraceae bacterium]